MTFLCPCTVAPPGFTFIPTDAVVHEGEAAVKFDSFPTGNPSVSVSWTFNKTVIKPETSSGKYAVGSFGEPNFGSLTIFNVSYYDHGRYTCTARNDIGSVDISAQLIVQGTPDLNVHIYI